MLSNIENWRGISKLNVFAKIFEGIIIHYTISNSITPYTVYPR